MADWTVTVGGKPFPWTQIEVTFEQFHTPANYAIQAPLAEVDIPALLSDTHLEVSVRRDGDEFFVGELDVSKGSGDDGDGPDDFQGDTLVLTGRDLSGRFVRRKVVETLPQNLTSSEMVKQFCLEAGFTEKQLAITRTSAQIGDFIRRNYHSISRGLSRHDVLFDLAELEHFVFRVWRRQPFFGPQPAPARTFPVVYRRDFNQYEWEKSHNNEDVTVRVISWNPKTKKKVSQVMGSGDLVITKIVPGLTPLQAKSLANRINEEAKRNLLTLEITGMPGNTAVNDVLYAFNVSGIAKGIDQIYYPSRVHHVITQDDHLMDLSLYNSARITA
jgi:hypothetical protein